MKLGYQIITFFLDLLPKLLNEIKDKDLLAVGCGTGNGIEKFAKLKKGWKITGIDPSPDMIKQAIEKLKNYSNVTLIEGLITDLKIEKKYSAAMLLLVLHFMKDNGNKLKLLKDIANRLISGATFVILDITGDENQIRQNLKVLKLLLPIELDKEQRNERITKIENKLYPVSEERFIFVASYKGNSNDGDYSL